MSKHVLLSCKYFQMFGAMPDFFIFCRKMGKRCTDLLKHMHEFMGMQYIKAKTESVHHADNDFNQKSFLLNFVCNLTHLRLFFLFPLLINGF